MWFGTIKTPIVLYQRCMAKVLCFRLIRFFFFFSCDCGAKNHSKGPQRNGINHGTHIIYRTVLSAGLWLFTSIWSRNNRFSLSLLYGKSHATGQCQCHWCIPVNVLGHINKIVEQYNKFNRVSRVPVLVTKKKNDNSYQ